MDLSNDGHIELICTIDVTERAFYTGLVVLSQQLGKIVRADASTQGANMVHLASHIGDLKHDGKKEILVPQLLGPYRGGEPAVELPDIYKFDHGQLIETNQEFREYYNRTVLPHLEAKLNAILNDPKATDRQKWIAVLRKEIADVQKRYGE
jgi:hypothetical protein